MTIRRPITNAFSRYSQRFSSAARCRHNSKNKPRPGSDSPIGFFASPRALIPPSGKFSPNSASEKMRLVKRPRACSLGRRGLTRKHSSHCPKPHGSVALRISGIPPTWPARTPPHLTENKSPTDSRLRNPAVPVFQSQELQIFFLP